MNAKTHATLRKKRCALGEKWAMPKTRSGSSSIQTNARNLFSKTFINIETGGIMMKKTIITLACSLIAPLAFAQMSSKGTRQGTNTAEPITGTGTLQGIVKDPKGHPIKGADIRIEVTNSGKLLKAVKTVANGRYISDGLPPGTYRVTLVLNGAVKASINNAKVTLGEPTQLNFDLRLTSASQASAPAKKGTHWVWQPAQTGSRLPGHWVLVDDSGSWAAAAGPLNVIRISAEELERRVHTVDIPYGR